jgi:hypothetical protein
VPIRSVGVDLRGGVVYANFLADDVVSRYWEDERNNNVRPNVSSSYSNSPLELNLFEYVLTSRVTSQLLSCSCTASGKSPPARTRQPTLQISLTGVRRRYPSVASIHRSVD